MSIKSKLGKAAAGTVIAGVVTFSGMSLANAADVAPAPSDSTVTTTDPSIIDSGSTGSTDGTTTDGGGSAAPTPGDGTSEVILDPIVSPTPDPTPAPVDPAPAPAPAPAPEAPGKSADHRASTPQQALDHNQSHKQKTADTEDEAGTVDDAS